MELIQNIEFWEMLSYVVTVFGLPLAIGVFLYEQRRSRQGDEEEIFQYLSEEYAEFQKLVLKNADLGLITGSTGTLTAEQRERKQALYDILISLFERAYILVYDDKMNKQTARLWATWDDYIQSWCLRDDFRNALPELLSGEDEDFVAYMLDTAKQIS
jgi:hypothetical protein